MASMPAAASVVETKAQPAEIRRALAIQNYGASGTVFLQSLLDGHPQILSLPSLYGRTLYPFYERCGHLPYVEFMREFFLENQYWFDDDVARTHPVSTVLGMHQMGENRDQPLVVPLGDFIDAFDAGFKPYADLPPEKRRAHFIKAVYQAYDVARGTSKARAGASWLLYPIHDSLVKHAQWLRADFPECRILHMVREPMQNIGSVIKHVLEAGHLSKADALHAGVAQILNDYNAQGEVRHINGYHGFFPVREVPTVAVKLEDLHLHSKNTLQALVKWLGISWDDRLMESTFNGLSWWNRPKGKRVSGFNKDIVSQGYEQFLSKRDRFILAPLARRQQRAWGYGKPASTLALIMHLPFLFLPLSMESGNWNEYKKCRRWLLMAWWKSLINREELVPLLETL